MNRLNFALLLLCMICMVTGCAKGIQPQEPPKAQTTIEADLQLADEIQAALKQNKAVADSVAVVLGKDISTAIKVSGLDRLRLKQIRKEVHDTIGQLTATDYSIHITTDKRLFSDLSKIAAKLQSAGGTAPPQIQDQVEMLNKDMAG